MFLLVPETPVIASKNGKWPWTTGFERTFVFLGVLLPAGFHKLQNSGKRSGRLESSFFKSVSFWSQIIDIKFIDHIALD